MQRVSYVESPSNGHLRLECELGQLLRPGHIIARICEPVGAEVEVKSQVSDLVFRIQTSGFARAGERIASIARAEDY